MTLVEPNKTKTHRISPFPNPIPFLLGWGSFLTHFLFFLYSNFSREGKHFTLSTAFFTLCMLD